MLLLSVLGLSDTLLLLVLLLLILDVLLLSATPRTHPPQPHLPIPLIQSPLSSFRFIVIIVIIILIIITTIALLFGSLSAVIVDSGLTILRLGGIVRGGSGGGIVEGRSEMSDSGLTEVVFPGLCDGMEEHDRMGERMSKRQWNDLEVNEGGCMIKNVPQAKVPRDGQAETKVSRCDPKRLPPPRPIHGPLPPLKSTATQTHLLQVINQFLLHSILIKVGSDV